MKSSLLTLMMGAGLACGACGDTKPVPTSPEHSFSGGEGISAERCDPPVCGDGHATACSGDTDEACDGDDLRGLGCTEYGFAGGALACSSQCTVDTSRCQPCGDDARIEQCAAIETSPGHSYGLGLAWRDGLLLVAMAIGPQNALSEADPHPLRLLAFDAELKAIGEPRELGVRQAWIVGLVAVSDGFLLAYLDGWPGRGAPLRTQHLDENGVPDAAPVDHAGVGSGYLVARPDGGPLFVANPTPEHLVGFTDGGLPPANPPRAGQAVLAILLDEQGREVWVTRTDAEWSEEHTAGAYTGDGFLLPLDGHPRPPAILSIDLDGNLAPSAWEIPSAGQDGVASSPQLAWDGSSASVVWSDTTADITVCPEPKPVPNAARDAAAEGILCERVPSELRWARLDHSAGLLEGPSTMPGITRATARFIASDHGHVLVTGQPTVTTGVTSGLVVRRYDQSLTPSGDPVTLVREPENAPVDTDTTLHDVRRFEVAFGPEHSVFVAWTRVSERIPHGLLGIAKVGR
jgi:hypothetical protein